MCSDCGVDAIKSMIDSLDLIAIKRPVTAFALEDVELSQCSVVGETIEMSLPANHRNLLFGRLPVRQFVDCVNQSAFNQEPMTFLYAIDLRDKRREAWDRMESKLISILRPQLVGSHSPSRAALQHMSASSTFSVQLYFT